jgi:DNA polymerase-1
MTGLKGVQFDLVDSLDEAQRFLSWLGQKRPNDAISIDTETGELPGNDRNDALSPWKGQLRLVQVGDGMQGWSIPWDTWKGVFYQGMNRYEGLIVCHNIAFEAKFFELHSSWKIPWHRSHDTMIMAQLLDPLGSGALKSLTAKYIDPYAAHLQDELSAGLAKNGWTWGTVPVEYEPYWAYGALDPILTMRLFARFWPQVKEGTPYHYAYELEMNTRRIVTRMELNGARLDLNYSQKKYDELIGYTEQVKDWVKNTYKASVTSNAQMARLFQDTLGAHIDERTPSGQASLSKDQLKYFTINGSEPVKQLADVMLKQRKADKLAGTYFLNFLNGNTNGFVHPSIKTMGARTGRMSIQNPALQTLPKGDDVVRRAFLPKDDDHVIITSDLDQVEFRMFASLSKDANLISLFHNADATGSDPFTEIGREIYQDPSMQKSDKRRALIKGVVYGRLYGAGVSKQALTAGVPEEQMRSVSNAFDRRFPGMQVFQKDVEALGMRHLHLEGQGYVNTWTGRRLPCDEDRVYTLVNYMIQGGAAEVFKSNLVKLDQADLTELLIVPVHDEIVLNAPRGQAEEIQRIVKECMTTTDGWEVQLTADVDGPLENWGAKY